MRLYADGLRARTGDCRRYLSPLSWDNRARAFVRACLGGHWYEAKSMVEGMLAEPWHLRDYQEFRLREFLDLMPNH